MTELDLTTVHKCCICDGDIEHHKTEEGKTYWTQTHTMLNRSKKVSVVMTVTQWLYYQKGLQTF